MDTLESLHGFHLNDNHAVYEEVEPVAAVQCLPALDNRQRLLPFDR